MQKTKHSQVTLNTVILSLVALGFLVVGGVKVWQATHSGRLDEGCSQIYSDGGTSGWSSVEECRRYYIMVEDDDQRAASSDALLCFALFIIIASSIIFYRSHFSKK